MHDGGLLNAQFDRVLNQVEDQIKEGKRSIEISFIYGANIPLFPRELLISNISDLLSQHGKDGISNPQDKVNIIVTTHSTINAQDAYTIMSAGYYFIYNPHLTGRTRRLLQELSS